MYKLKLGKHQIFVIDENRKICGVFYNLNQALDFVDEKNCEMAYIEMMEENYKYVDLYDRYEFEEERFCWVYN